MIGYKATINGRCKDQLYEVGQIYVLDDELIMCKKGFHFCEDLFDVFDYYPPNKNTKVFKVEALGNTITNDDKSVTDKIKILEEVSLANLKLKKNGREYGKKYEFNDRGRVIKIECSSGYWEKYEYNENNDCIKIEDINGSWWKYEYDSNGNLIRIEKSDGSWEKIEYDKNNNEIKREEDNGYWVKYKYNENNYLIEREDSVGFWEKYEYDESNNRLKIERGKG